MSEIREYRQVEFNKHVRPQGCSKLIKMTAKHDLRLYRDMSEPETLVIEQLHPLRRDDVPWESVQVAYRKVADAAPARTAEAPKVEQQSERPPQQNQQNRNR